MKTYKFQNGTIYVHGKLNKDRLQRATIELRKGSYAYKINRKEPK